MKLTNKQINNRLESIKRNKNAHLKVGTQKGGVKGQSPIFYLTAPPFRMSTFMTKAYT